MGKIDIDISDSEPEKLRKDIIEILSKSDLEFSDNKLIIKLLTGGTSNILYLVTIDSPSKSKLLFRIYGAGSEHFIDRQQEIESMKILAKHGLGAPLVAEFNNGICYHYAKGSPISIQDIQLENIYSLVAKKLAKIHQIPLESKRNVLWMRIENFIKLAPEFENGEQYGNGIFNSKEDLFKEFNFLKGLLENCDSPLVFCHLDLNLPNILYDGTDVNFIDVEYAGCTYAAFDIANHFVQYVGVEDVLDWVKWYPKKDFQISWLRKYYAAFSETITESQIVATYELVQKFVLCSHLHWGAWNLVQAKVSELDYDFKDWAKQSFTEYARMKKIVFPN